MKFDFPKGHKKARVCRLKNLLDKNSTENLRNSELIKDFAVTVTSNSQSKIEQKPIINEKVY